MRKTINKGLLYTGMALTALLPAAAIAEGDPEAGKIIGYTCTGCHGIAGYKNVYPTYNVPKIAGQRPEYIEAALLAYKSGERSHPTMSLHAEGLSAQDIADIAAWISTLEGEEE